MFLLTFHCESTDLTQRSSRTGLLSSASPLNIGAGMCLSASQPCKCGEHGELAVARSPCDTQQFSGVHLVALPVLVNKLDFSQRQALLLHPARSINFLFHLLPVVCFNPSLSHPSLLWSSSCLSCSPIPAGGTCLAAFPSSKLAPRRAAL